MTKGRLSSIQRDGQLDGMGAFNATTVGISAAAGLVGGVLLWVLLKKR